MARKNWTDKSGQIFKEKFIFLQKNESWLLMTSIMRGIQISLDRNLEIKNTKNGDFDISHKFELLPE